MKKLVFLFAFLFTSGCSIFQPEESIIIQPQLLKQSSLPAIRASIYKDKFEFLCEMLVDQKGDVEQARMLTQSGDALWDSLAALSLLNWKFAPATLNGTPVKLLIRRKVMVLFEQPQIIPLAEIMFSNYEQADSVYKALLNNADFYKLALMYSISQTKTRQGVIGYIDINQYSDKIRNVLKRLDEDEFTEPLNYGNYFVIFKRIKQNNL